MDDQAIYAIMPHPAGGYAAVKADLGSPAPPPAGIDDPQFETVTQAIKYVEAMGDRFVVVDTHPDDVEEALSANSEILESIKSEMEDPQISEILQLAQDLSTLAKACEILKRLATEKDEAKELVLRLTEFTNNWAEEIQDQVQSISRAMGLGEVKGWE
ncbi:hypothetical protein SEA_KEELAN_82 [Gordonia phage Keelan]|nr:hypothetical protein SEA_KEELAN_82 [Gordonia phage Keelan]